MQLSWACLIARQRRIDKRSIGINTASNIIHPVKALLHQPAAHLGRPNAMVTQNQRLFRHIQLLVNGERLLRKLAQG